MNTEETARQPMRLRAFNAIAQRWWTVALVSIMAVAVVFNLFDPVALGFEVLSGWAGFVVALIVGYFVYRLFIGVGADATLGQTTALVKKWTRGHETVRIGKLVISAAMVVVGIIAFATSLPELGFTFTAVADNEGDALLGSILGSDGFNVWVNAFATTVMFGTAFFAARRLGTRFNSSADFVSKRFWLATFVAFLVTLLMLLVTIVGFVPLLALAIIVVSMVAVLLFLISPPQGIEKEAETKTPALSMKKLALGFALLLLGTAWLFNAALVVIEFLDMPKVVAGIAAAIITSIGEIRVLVPAMKRGEMTLPAAAGLVLMSNMFDTAFASSPAVFGLVHITTGSTATITTAVVTALMTAWLLFVSIRKRVSVWETAVITVVYICTLLYSGAGH